MAKLMTLDDKVRAYKELLDKKDELAEQMRKLFTPKLERISFLRKDWIFSMYFVRRDSGISLWKEWIQGH